MPTLLLKMPPTRSTAHTGCGWSSACHPACTARGAGAAVGREVVRSLRDDETGADLRVTDVDHDQLVGSGCVGAATRAKEARIVDGQDVPVPRGDTGGLVLRGPGLMDRYEADPEATEGAFRGGWFPPATSPGWTTRAVCTSWGDSGHDPPGRGERGRPRSRGCSPDAPRRPLAAVVAVPDELRGEEVMAFVSPLVTRTPTRFRERTRRVLRSTLGPLQGAEVPGGPRFPELPGHGVAPGRQSRSGPAPGGRGTEWTGMAMTVTGPALLPVR